MWYEDSLQIPAEVVIHDHDPVLEKIAQLLRLRRDSDHGLFHLAVVIQHKNSCGWIAGLVNDAMGQ